MLPKNKQRALILQTTKLAIDIAIRYWKRYGRKYHIDRDDLKQVALGGVCEAASKYDNQTRMFSSFAINSIESALTKFVAVECHKGIYGCKRVLSKSAFTLPRVIMELKESFDTASDEDLAYVMDLDKEKIRALRNAMWAKPYDIEHDYGFYNQHILHLKPEDVEQVKPLVASLPKDERRVIKLAFGWIGGDYTKPLTDKEREKIPAILEKLSKNFDRAYLWMVRDG
jgi:DNA-directed RNA polymerase specialized sigma subunit